MNIPLNDYVVVYCTQSTALFVNGQKEIKISTLSSNIEVTYFENGKIHRPIEEGPAFESWDADGRLWRRSYWINGKMQNNNGTVPAKMGWWIKQSVPQIGGDS